MKKNFIFVPLVLAGLFIPAGYFFLNSKRSESPTQEAFVKKTSPLLRPLIRPSYRREPAQKTKPEGSFQTQQARAESLIQEGGYQEAVALLESVLLQEPGNVAVLEQLGMLYATQLSDPIKAAAIFKKTLSLDSGNEFALQGLLLLPGDSKELAESLVFLEGLHKAHPDASGVASEIAELLLNQGRSADAISYLESATKDPSFAAGAHTRIAGIYELSGNLAKSQESYRKAIASQILFIEQERDRGTVSDGSEEALARTRVALANLLINEGKFPEAYALLDEARRVLRDDSDILSLQERAGNEAP